MIEKLRQRFGDTTQVISVQEYFKHGDWIKCESSRSVQDQIDDSIAQGATILSFHATVEEIDDDSEELKTINIYPDVIV